MQRSAGTNEKPDLLVWHKIDWISSGYYSIKLWKLNLAKANLEKNIPHWDEVVRMFQSDSHTLTSTLMVVSSNAVFKIYWIFFSFPTH